MLIYTPDIASLPYMLYRESLHLARERMERKEADQRAKFHLEQRQIWLTEYNAGLISKKEYRTLVYGEPASEHSLPQPRRLSSQMIMIDEDDDEVRPSGSDDFVGEGWSP